MMPRSCRNGRTTLPSWKSHAFLKVNGNPPKENFCESLSNWLNQMLILRQKNSWTERAAFIGQNSPALGALNERVRFAVFIVPEPFACLRHQPPMNGAATFGKAFQALGSGLLCHRYSGCMLRA